MQQHRNKPCNNTKQHMQTHKKARQTAPMQLQTNTCKQQKQTQRNNTCNNTITTHATHRPQTMQQKENDNMANTAQTNMQHTNNACKHRENKLVTCMKTNHVITQPYNMDTYK